MKFENVSKPSQLENLASGSGKMAISRKTRGRSSQAMELLVEMEFFLSSATIVISSNIVAMDISIWMLVIFASPET